MTLIINFIFFQFMYLRSQQRLYTESNNLMKMVILNNESETCERKYSSLGIIEFTVFHYRKINFFFYVHVTVHRNKFLCNTTNRRANFPNVFCQETLHVSGSSSAHRQESSTVISALVYVTQVSMTAFMYD
jgi:hypothetical protein